MTRKTTNLIGILAVIVAGTYFFAGYCSSCAATMGDGFPLETPNQVAAASGRHGASGILNVIRYLPDSIPLNESKEAGNMASGPQNVTN